VNIHLPIPDEIKALIADSTIQTNRRLDEVIRLLAVIADAQAPAIETVA